jgi:hypothetical protein
MPSELLFYLSRLLISSGVFSPSDGTEARRHREGKPETGTTVAVHQVTGLKALGQPGPGQPAWAALMARMRRKTLVVCAGCHEHIHAAPVALAA